MDQRRLGAFWSLAGRMARYPRLLAAACVFALVSAGSLGAGLVGVKPVIDRILGQDAGMPELLAPAAAWPVVGPLITPELLASLPTGAFTAMVWLMAGLGLLTLVGAVANFLHAFFSLTMVNRTTTAIRREAFRRVLRLPLGSVVSAGGPEGSGSAPSDLISRIINDTGQLQGGLIALVSKAMAQALKGAAALTAALVIEWRVTLAALVIGPVLIAVIRRLGKKIRRASRAALESQSRLLAAAAEALQGLRVVKVHTAERYEAGRFHRLNKSVMREQMRMRTARALASPLVEVLTIFALGAIVLIVGKQILDGTLEKGAFILAIVALGAAGASLKPLTGLVNDVQASAAAADRLERLMTLPAEPGHDRALPRLPPLARSIEFRGVRFTYPHAPTPALAGVDLTITRGETVALVGPNGSGKTTLMSLVPRLFDPQAGAVLFDGADARSFNVRSLRRRIGVVTQETVLFAGTIRDNIAYGTGVADEARIREAARRAGADGFVERLPRGYGTPVGELGQTLSGGQRQRLAIARAVLRDPSILLLDEATSMIDADSEAAIAASLAAFSKGRTCLIIAHRLSTVMSADRIVVMDRGRIVDQGSHRELIDRCPVYATIARHQLIPAPGPKAAAAAY
jgi:subfamily B ATP-binding cassette protein MsbA